MTDLHTAERAWIEEALYEADPECKDPRGFAEHLLALCEEYEVPIERLVEALHEHKKENALILSATRTVGW